MNSAIWTRRVWPALLFSGALVLYLSTLAPTVTLVDSGELIVAARNLGVAHPPGFPLYLLIAHLATLMPAGSIAQRVHLVSAVCAGLAVSVLYLTVTEIVIGMRARASGRNAARSRAQRADRFMIVPGLVAAALFAFSRTLWSYATVAEVYTLNVLLILLVFLLTFRWRNMVLAREGHAGWKDRPPPRHGEQEYGHKRPDASGRVDRRQEDRLLYLAAFVFGLGLGVHHVTVVLTLPALAWLVYKTEGVRFFRSRRLPETALACLLGAAVYAYLPLAAARSPVPNWGNPTTLGRFWSHVSGRQYLSHFALAPDQIHREASSFVALASREFGWMWAPAGLLLAIGGFVVLGRRDPTLFGFVALVMVSTILFALAYEIAEDKNAYYLPAFIAMAMAAGVCVYAWLCAAPTGRILPAAGIAVLAPLLAFAGNLRINDRRDYFVAEDYVSNILSTVSPNGLLLTGDWQVASPMLYFQEIVRQRPDVICIDIQLLRRSWYFLYLESEHPALMLQARSSVQLFLEDLLQWESDPGLYETDVFLNQRITARFQAMIGALIRAHISTAPVYATQDVVMSQSGEGQGLSSSLRAAYQILPQGLVYRLFADRDIHPAMLPQLRTRGLTNGAPAVKEDEVVRQKVVPVYVTMMVNCGRAFASQGDMSRAIEAYRQASTIDPTMVQALERQLPAVSPQRK